MDQEKRKFLKQLFFGVVGLSLIKIISPFSLFSSSENKSEGEAIKDLKVVKGKEEYSFYNKKGKKVLVVKK